MKWRCALNLTSQSDHAISRSVGWATTQSELSTHPMRARNGIRLTTRSTRRLGTAIRTAFSSGVAGATALVSGSVNLYLVSPKLAAAMLALLPVMAVGANLMGVPAKTVLCGIRLSDAFDE